MAAQTGVMVCAVQARTFSQLLSVLTLNLLQFFLSNTIGNTDGCKMGTACESSIFVSKELASSTKSKDVPAETGRV